MRKDSAPKAVAATAGLGDLKVPITLPAIRPVVPVYFMSDKSRLRHPPSI